MEFQCCKYLGTQCPILSAKYDQVNPIGFSDVGPTKNPVERRVLVNVQRAVLCCASGAQVIKMERVSFPMAPSSLGSLGSRGVSPVHCPKHGSLDTR
jgi:hypothetical protein